MSQERDNLAWAESFKGCISYPQIQRSVVPTLFPEGGGRLTYAQSLMFNETLGAVMRIRREASICAARHTAAPGDGPTRELFLEAIEGRAGALTVTAAVGESNGRVGPADPILTIPDECWQPLKHNLYGASPSTVDSCTRIRFTAVAETLDDLLLGLSRRCIVRVPGRWPVFNRKQLTLQLLTPEERVQAASAKQVEASSRWHFAELLA